VNLSSLQPGCTETTFAEVNSHGKTQKPDSDESRKLISKTLLAG
jgi:hypothetical protein